MNRYECGKEDEWITLMAGGSDAEHLRAEFCVFPPGLEFMICFMHVAGAWAPVVVFVTMLPRGWAAEGL